MKQFYLKAIRFYQLGISPFIKPRCRFIPSCSDYSMEAIQTQGAWKGTWLGLKRLLRCHPFAKAGWDPVSK